MKILYNLICLALLTTIAACTKDSKKPVYINEDFKQHFSYKPGTYWVFYDSLTGALDTFTITENRDLSPFFTPGDPLETVNMTMMEKYNGKALLWGLNITAPDGFGLNQDKITMSIGLIQGWPITPLENQEFLSSWQCRDSVYSNVYKTNRNIPGYYNSTFYISQNLGFVGITINSDSINRKMYLTDYKIVH